jgi:hypothetical protein
MKHDINLKFSLIASAIASSVACADSESPAIKITSNFILCANESERSALISAKEAPHGGEPMPPLSDVRTMGRHKSLYLKSTNMSTNAPATDGTPNANLGDFKAHIAPTLKDSCISCHGPDKQKGQFRVDTLNPDLLKGDDMSKWQKVFDVVSSEEMPPDNDKNIHLEDQQRSKLTTWLETELKKASKLQNELGTRSSFRRLTRYEYNYALQDLTGLNYEFSEVLPPETASKDGFLNSSSLLQMSGMQLEKYREIGLTALQKATVKGGPPPVVSYCLSAQNLMTEASKVEEDIKYATQEHVHFKDLKTGKLLRFHQDFQPKFSISTNFIPLRTPEPSTSVMVIGPNQSVKLNLGSKLPDAGNMRVRLRMGRSSLDVNEHASVRLIFSAHTSNDAHFSEIVSHRDIPITASAGNMQFIDFDIPLSEITRNPFRKKNSEIGRSDEFLTIQIISNIRNKNNEGLEIFADYIEIVAPFYEKWPPKSHEDIFIDSKNKRDEKIYASEILRKFMTKAWRRPVTAEEMAPFLSLFDSDRLSSSCFEDAMLEVLSTVLATPDFLYLTQKIKSSSVKKSLLITDYELASRLSFFLWCSIPDQELLSLASQGKLSDPKILAQQTKRMLADSRSQRFSKHFVDQWLGLDALVNVKFDTSQFKAANDTTLKEAMREEPIAFFNEILHQNKSVMDFIHSDYVMVNERLARHYEIPGVYGPEFRAVPVAASMNRGGLMTQAAVLAMNSDGKDSNPVKRGVWILKRLLNDPPPPPPPNVPQVDLTNPEIAKLTLKERIADHRNNQPVSHVTQKLILGGSL